MRHAASAALDRHCHHDPFITLVLSGGYVEAGDEGRRRVGPGDVLLHRAFESHLDRFDNSGAEVLVLPLTTALANVAPLAGTIADPDFIVRLAEKQPASAARRLLDVIQPRAAIFDDWPDRLATDLGRLAPFSLGDWADQAGLRAETVSRGFRRAYGTSPKAFRATARARAAFAAIGSPGCNLSFVAADLGFADQAHMTHAVTSLTGSAPASWRRASTGSAEPIIADD
ncbi:MAG: AraC family transcriptional regulator [Sphingomonas sp.]